MLGGENMKITFCLPAILFTPRGGYKIVYEYANRLSSLGHNVTIAYFCTGQFKKYRLPEFLRKFLCNVLLPYSDRWFKFNNNVKRIIAIDNKNIISSDIIVATAVETAKRVASLPAHNSKKYYFIQDYENWHVTDEYVHSTYRLEMNKLVVSKWLKQIVDQYSTKPSMYLPNPINNETFYINRPIEKRNPYSIALLYHTREQKGLKYAFEALNNVKEKYPQLEVNLFGVVERPDELPKWYRYTQKATEKQLLEIYNNSAIFVCASTEEGYGLTAVESMACGCALVASTYRGVYEYAVDGVNALLSPIRDPKTMSRNIERLICDNELRHFLAHSGSENVKKINWESNVLYLEKEFQKNLKG